MGFGPYCGIASEAGDIFELEVSDACTGVAGEDGMLECFWTISAAGAVEVWVHVAPGGVRG